MFLKAIRDVGKPQLFAVMDLLKRSTGMSVAEMSKALGMSYMGVKQHCIDLEKKGYLDTWRRPKSIGRPEKTYRLTPKAASFFPEVGCDLTLQILDSVAQIYGSQAPDKLLFNSFTKKTEAYAKKVKGDTVEERAISLAKSREQEGHLSEVEQGGATGLQIVEYHNPLREIAEKYENVARMEETMFQNLLQAPVSRRAEVVSGLTKFIFEVG